MDYYTWTHCCILTFDPAKHAIPKWCTGRKLLIPMASNRKKSRRQIWLTKWDKVKAHDTLIDWCTGREWPLNCMTVISAWWRSNIPFQRLCGRLSGRLNYYITWWRQEVRSSGPEKLETRCGNLLSFLLRCGTRPYERGTQWDLNSLV